MIRSLFRVCGLRGLIIALLQACSIQLFADDFQEFEKRNFAVEGKNAFLIVPKQMAEGRPWIWRTEFFGHEPQADLALLGKGFHVAYVDMQNLYGGPAAMGIMDAMYAHVTSEFKLSPKVVLEGFSRGGLFTLNWAARHPDQVACIYNDAPVCDFKSWPAAKGKAKGSPSDWERVKRVYGFATEADAEKYALNPVDNTAPLAAARIPLLHVCGETDQTVPLDENSGLLAQRLRDQGGVITIIAKPNCDHHPHSLKDPTHIVNFVLTHTGFPKQVVEATTPYGYDYFQLRGQLDRCRAKFERDKVGRVAFLGGSITAAPGWRDQVCDDLKQRFPDTKFDFINAGISSLGSTPGAFRFQRDVLKNGPVDLLFEEAAVNDDTNGFSDVEQIRGMEGIVRHARLSNPAMDIVLLHFVDPGKMKQILRGEIPTVIANHEKVAEQYQLPSINLAREVTERIHAGEFSWEKDFKDLHPSPFGHDLYARSIQRLFDAAWKVASPNPSPLALPKPVDPHSYFHGQLISPRELSLNSGSIDIERGWNLVPDWTPGDGKATREGFVKVPVLVGEKSGSTFRMKFQGTAIGLFVAAGPDTGQIEYRVDQGEWRTQDFFTQWSPSLHLPWAKMLASDLEPSEHVLEVKIAPTADTKSLGRAIRIVYFLVNSPAAGKK